MDGLERLRREFSAGELSILGFPTDDFHQLGTREELKSDFESVFDVLFEPLALADNPVFDKLVRAGQGSGEKPADVEWNFVKFLVDQDGRVLRRYGPGMDADKIAADIRDELR